MVWVRIVAAGAAPIPRFHGRGPRAASDNCTRSARTVWSKELLWQQRQHTRPMRSRTHDKTKSIVRPKAVGRGMCCGGRGIRSVYLAQPALRFDQARGFGVGVCGRRQRMRDSDFGDPRRVTGCPSFLALASARLGPKGVPQSVVPIDRRNSMQRALASERGTSVRQAQCRIYSKVLIPVDGSAASMAGVHEATRIATTQQAEFRLLHIADEFHWNDTFEPGTAGGAIIEAIREEGKRILRDATNVLAAYGLVAVARQSTWQARQSGWQFSEGVVFVP